MSTFSQTRREAKSVQKRPEVGHEVERLLALATREEKRDHRQRRVLRQVHDVLLGLQRGQ